MASASHLPACGTGPEAKPKMTTQRAPYKTRRWTETEEAALRSMGEAGKDARSIGKRTSQVFYGRPGQGQEIEDYLAPREDMIMRESPSRRNDLMVATIAGLLAWVITLALRTALGG
jgi:hypothetical protein